MLYTTPTLPNELYHHGIKGQKWGVRRYQNEDGSYTAAGRKRYGMDLDIDDRSRKNVAKIRLGEARRRLDVAKENAKTTNNNYRVAQTQERVRAAKRAVRDSGKIDKGAKLAAKGQTITDNNAKLGAIGLAATAAILYGKYKGITPSDIIGKGTRLFAHAKYGRGKDKAQSMLKLIGAASAAGLVGGYVAKKKIDNSNLRAYNNASWNGNATIKSIGSDEYAAVKERRSKK